MPIADDFAHPVRQRERDGLKIKQTDSGTDGYTNNQTTKQTDKYTDDKHTDRQWDKKTQTDTSRDRDLNKLAISCKSRASRGDEIECDTLKDQLKDQRRARFAEDEVRHISLMANSLSFLMGLFVNIVTYRVTSTILLVIISVSEERLSH